MLTASKWLFIIGGVLAIRDSIFLFFGIPNFFGLPLPCPLMLLVFGVGVILFVIRSEAFQRR